MANVVTISGMFGEGHTYFADSPVVIDINGLQWPSGSPFNVVRVEVVHNSNIVGDFRNDTGGQSTWSVDISSALRAIWSDVEFSTEIAEANDAAASESQTSHTATRGMREYILRIWTEYIASDGYFTTTQCAVVIDGREVTDIPGGQCMIGGLTEWERYNIVNKEDADASHWDHSNPRNGDASTKPTSTPEHVGRDSITSWVDVANEGTKSIFYPAGNYPPGYYPDEDDPANRGDNAWKGHAPIVLRDSQPYIDFLFVNRRGAIETCSALMKESMDIRVETTQYARMERPTFKPSRSLMATSTDGRRSWSMSSGYVTREWAEWWVMEFLGGSKKKQWWMRYPIGSATAKFVPVTVAPSKKSIDIYDRNKQQMPHVDFTVTLGLEG